MSETTRGGAPVQPPTTQERWALLEVALQEAQAVMAGPDDRLVITAPASSGGPGPEVRLRGRTQVDHIRATISTGAQQLAEDIAAELVRCRWRSPDARSSRWRVSAPRDWIPSTAAVVVMALEEGLGVPDPGLLTFEVRGQVDRVAARLAATGMTPVGEVPVDPLDAVLSAHERVSSLELIRPSGRDDAVELVRAVVQGIVGSPPEVDEDGDVLIETPWGRVYLRVDPDGEFVDVFTWVVRQVTSPLAAARELAAHHGRGSWSTWVLQGQTVIQRRMIPMAPFVPEVIDRQVKAFLVEHAQTVEALRLRIEKESA